MPTECHIRQADLVSFCYIPVRCAAKTQQRTGDGERATDCDPASRRGVTDFYYPLMFSESLAESPTTQLLDRLDRTGTFT
jgi:hypothetical protein